MKQDQEAEFHSAWYDVTLDAESWWRLSNVTPLQAAKLLCGFNPDDDTIDPQTVTTDETSPEDFKRPLREFDDEAWGNAKPRTLSQWHDIAIARHLKHHKWIDDYRQIIDGERQTEQPLEDWEQKTLEQKKASWNALSPEGRFVKADELTKKHHGNKTAAGREVGVTGNRNGQILKEQAKVPEGQPAAPSG
jgi:hypothetical protein